MKFDQNLGREKRNLFNTLWFQINTDAHKIQNIHMQPLSGEYKFQTFSKVTTRDIIIHPLHFLFTKSTHEVVHKSNKMAHCKTLVMLLHQDTAGL